MLHESPGSGFTRGGRELEGLETVWKASCFAFYLFSRFSPTPPRPQAMPWWQGLKLHLDLSETKSEGSTPSLASKDGLREREAALSIAFHSFSVLLLLGPDMDVVTESMTEGLI